MFQLRHPTLRAEFPTGRRSTWFLFCIAACLVTGPVRADEVRGGNPEDRPPADAPGESPPQPKPCVIYALRRGSPYNNTDYRFGCAGGGSCVPMLSPDNAPLFQKVRHLWIWIGTEMTKENALMTDNRPEDHYFGWSRCMFSNSRDRTKSTGGWSPQTQPYKCMPFDRLRSPAGRTHEVSIERGDPVPEVIHYQDVDYKITTNGQLGSEQCFAIIGGMTSPLVLDTAGKGLKFTAAGSHVEFDLGDGLQPTMWLANSGDAPFLALDLNGNDRIDDYQELFGNTTPGPDKKPVANGFEALAKYDQNSDKLIDAKDAVFEKLLLWADKNANGRTDAGELGKLSASGTKSISLAWNTKFEFQDNHGNLSNSRSSAEFGGGKTRFIYDVWFAPADPLGVKGASTGTISPHGVPKEGEKNYAEIHSGWQRAVDAAQFGDTEIPYDLGEIQTYIDRTGGIDHHVVTWPHVFDSCRVEATFSGDWSRMQNSQGKCS